MVQENQNQKITREYLKAFKFQQGLTPNLKASPIVSPIIDVNRKKEDFYFETNSNGFTLMTTPTGKETYLTMLSINLSDKLGAHTSSAISFTLFGGISISHKIDNAMGTGDKDHILYFKGLKLAEGTTITSTMGSDYGTLTIAGYFEDY